MIGDNPAIKPIHRKLAAEIFEIVRSEIDNCSGRYTISIAGESGSGKSSIAQALKAELAQHDLGSVILQQDDYFVLPPETNDKTRRKDIHWVGLGEVQLDLLDEHLRHLIDGKNDFEKPLIIYQEDRITREKISLNNVKVVIVEGTYITVLRNINCRIFIDLDYRQTKAFRDQRARDKQDQFIEQVLEIEHKIIASHKKKADLIITSNFKIIKIDR